METSELERAEKNFKGLLRSYAFFHAGFFGALLLELTALVFFFPFFSKSSVAAFSFGLFFLTLFSYFVLKFYFEAKKPEQFLKIRDDFIKEGNSLDATYELIHRLGQEELIFRVPTSETLSALVAKFSAWCFSEDLFYLRELLHLTCIEERLKEVRRLPTDPEAHADLASSYIALYKLYRKPDGVNYSFIEKAYASEERVQKFRKTALRAIEEFKILDAYSPDDRWVYGQLAAIYHDLALPKEEIAAYEKLLQLDPTDADCLFRLGFLYFQEGRTAEGLRLYAELKREESAKADELILSYTA